jgi:hypothetical protein
VPAGNWWNETFHSPGLEKFVSKSKRAEYVIATGLSKMGYGPDFPIRESPDMRLPGGSMPSEPTPRIGMSANALESAGMAAIASIAKLVDAEISFFANPEKLRVSAMMVVMQST